MNTETIEIEIKDLTFFVDDSGMAYVCAPDPEITGMFPNDFSDTLFFSHITKDAHDALIAILGLIFYSKDGCQLTAYEQRQKDPYYWVEMMTHFTQDNRNPIVIHFNQGEIVAIFEGHNING